MSGLRLKLKELVLPRELRQESISTHSVVLRALGAVGAELLEADPDGWKGRLQALRREDWRKSNADWDGVNIVANSVVSNRQARAATKAYLKKQLGLELTDTELRSITPASMQEQVAEVETPSSNHTLNRVYHFFGRPPLRRPAGLSLCDGPSASDRLLTSPTTSATPGAPARLRVQAPPRDGGDLPEVHRPGAALPRLRHRLAPLRGRHL